MVTVGTRLRIIRKDAGLSQVELGKLAGSNQSAINRYETDRAAVPYRMLIWYAQYFDVSMDYIFGLCDDKRGRIVTVSPEGAEEYVRRKPDWSEFVEACFTPGSSSLGVVVKIMPAPWFTASSKASSAFSSVFTFS